jgi:hypothetical protein
MDADRLRVARSRQQAPLLKNVGASERTSAGYVPPLQRSGGTEVSNPASSSGESAANRAQVKVRDNRKDGPLQRAVRLGRFQTLPRLLVVLRSNGFSCSERANSLRLRVSPRGCSYVCSKGRQAANEGSRKSD